MIKSNKSMVVNVWNVIVGLGFMLGLPPRVDFLKIVQVTMKRDPFNAM